jgi:maltose O-acetyltransferase
LGVEKDRMIKGEMYFAFDPELIEERLRASLLCERFNATSATQDDDRKTILKELLGQMGDDVTILPPFRCDYGYLLSIGSRAFINYNAIILDSTPVTIGERTWIGPGLQLYTACHPLDAATRTAERPLESASPITIGDDVWLGGGVIVLPGVTIGAESVIGAGSVVTRDIPPRVVAVGNPCRVIRKL